VTLSGKDNFFYHDIIFYYMFDAMRFLSGREYNLSYREYLYTLLIRAFVAMGSRSLSILSISSLNYWR
jgi:hypothetical protein